MQGEVGALVGDVRDGGGLGRYGVGDGEDAAFGRDGDLLGVATARERSGYHAQALLQIYTLPDGGDDARDLSSRGEGRLWFVLVLSPAEEDVKEVQPRRLDFYNDLARARLRLLYL